MTPKETDTYETFKWAYKKASSAEKRLLVFLYALHPEDGNAFRERVRDVIVSHGCLNEMIDTIKKDRVMVEPSWKDYLITYLGVK